jgi:parvulin-like peptidyl-prolyl isomerase
MGMMSIRRMAQKLLAPVIIALVIALTVGMFYIGFPRSQNQTGYKGPSIKIGGKRVSDAKFNQYIERATQQASQYQQYGLQYTTAQIRDTAISLAVRDYVIGQEEKHFKIKVADAEAEKLIKKYFPTEEELQSYLDKQGLTSKRQFVKEVVKMLEEQKLYVKKAGQSKIKVAKQDIEGYLEEITVRHILIGTADQSGKALRTDAEALTRAEEVVGKLANKGDFANLAKEYSDDPGSKDKGGVYGPMPVTQFKTSMVKEFVDTALGLKEGEISKPVKTQFGYHIIKLDKLAMPKGDEYKEKYGDIKESLLVQKFQESPAYSNWMKKQTTAAETKMEILDPALRAYRLTQKEKWAEAAKAYEKALKRKYYKGQWELSLDAAKAFVKAKDFAGALKILKQVPAEYQDMFDYQVTLASVYQENKQPKKAGETLLAYGSKHADDRNTHEQILQKLKEWKLTGAAAQETAIVDKLKQKEEADLKKMQEDIAKKNAQPAASPSVAPAPTAAQTTEKN